jgi:catechol 2,3-dioxygenase-like lactoylglutathione lyase family enzyme
MNRSIATLALVVRDYDEALSFFVGSLGFQVVEDTPMGKGKRWLVVAPSGGTGARLLLAQAKNDEERASIGRQAGGRVFLFLETDDFRRDHDFMKRNGVRFREEPRVEPYGTVAVFEDLYGNPWDLIEPRKPPAPSA